MIYNLSNGKNARINYVNRFLIITIFVLSTLLVIQSFMTSASTPGNIDSCQTLDTSGAYTLTRNINSTATCFNVTANNIVVDCGGFNITGMNSGFAFNTSNATRQAYTNLTIQNCTISNYTTSIYMVGGAGTATPVRGGNGGNVTVINSNLSGNIVTNGGDVGACATIGSCSGGNGGNITLIGSNASMLNSTGGSNAVFGNSNAKGGAIAITSSNVGGIYSRGGYAVVGPSGNAGNVTAIKSVINGDIYSDGGAQGKQGIDPGARGNGNLKSSSARDIVNYGSRLLLLISSGGSTTMGGANVYLTNSNVTSINNSGTDAPILPSNAGTIVLINSNVTEITSKGGDNSQSSWGQCLTAGNGGTITSTNSTVARINARGGNKFGCATNLDSGDAAGTGGNVHLINATLNISNMVFNLVGGQGGGASPINGTAGLLILNYTNLFVDNNASYGTVIKLKITNSSAGMIDWSANNFTSTNLKNISLDIRISNNFVYLNSTRQSMLNITANVSLFNSPGAGRLNLRINRDGIQCNETTVPPCSNYTLLNASTVIFNVASWTNYTIDGVSRIMPEFTGLTPVNYANLSQNWLFVNVTLLYIINQTNVTFFLYNSSEVNVTNFSTIVNTINWTNLKDGNYSYNVSICDFSAVCNSTVTIVVTLDTALPNGTLLSPVNGTASNNTIQNFTLNATDNLGIKNVTLNIVNASNIAQIINQTTTNIVSGTVNTVVGTVVTLIDGMYKWFYDVFDWAGNKFATNNRTITIDRVNTIVVNVTFSINTTDSIDPDKNLTFNVSVDDLLSGVNTVILQVNNGTTWTNYTMGLIDSTRKIYSANITLVHNQENYTYNVLANDTAGNVNQTINQTLESKWDCTWEVAPLGLGSVGGFFREKELGNISLINTGDAHYPTDNCSIVFARNYTGGPWQKTTGLNLSDIYTSILEENFPNSVKGLKYYDNGTEITKIRVNASENRTLTVNGMFPSYTSVLTEHIFFPIYASINDSIGNDQNVTITSIMVVTPGAYLQTAIEAPTSNQIVYLTPGTLNLSAYVKDVVATADNVNNTAYNVSFNWTLPDVLRGKVISGNLTNNYTNFTDTTKYYNNLTVEFTSANLVDLTQGVLTLNVYAYGYENSTQSLQLISHFNSTTVLSDSVNISLQCYNISDSVAVTSCGSFDPDNPASTTTVTTSSASSGGGGGGGAIESRADYTFIRGKTSEIAILFKNRNPNQTMTNLKFSVSGNIAKYMEVQPSNLASLGPGQETAIKLIVTSPTYIKLGRQEIILVISGQYPGTGYNENKKIVLQVVEISEDDANKLVEKMKDLILQLNGVNLTSSYLNRLLIYSKMQMLKGLILMAVADLSSWQN